MPKEGFNSITIPEDLDKRISNFLETGGNLVKNKTQAISHAWEIYEKIFLKENLPSPVKIGDKLVGPNEHIFIVGEIGLNHVGDLRLCKQIIDMAVRSGCDAVKFQKRNPDLCVPENQKNLIKETPWGNMTYLEYRKRMEFGEEEYKEIDRYCKERGILWFASPWDIDSVDFLEKLNVPCYKVPSACLTDKELLLKIKNTNKPVILSTGMSTLDQIEEALTYLDKEKLIILHCHSSYPAPLNELNLNVMKNLQKNFNCPVGYSGHETGLYPTIVAMAIGACMVERHITIDRSLFGGDQAASLEEKGISTICRESKRIKIYLGDGRKKVHDSEKKVMEKLRRYL